MNGVTLKDPFDTAQEPQTEGKYDFEQSLNALLSQDYAPNKIVEIMGAAGFDSYDVASSLNQKYDDQRREMWNDRKSLQDQLNSEKEAYDNVLKKKDTALVQDGVESTFGLDLTLDVDEQAKSYYEGLTNDQKFDQFGILSKSLALDKIKTNVLPTLTPPEAVNPPQATESVADVNLASINLIDDLSVEAYSDHAAAFQLKNAIAEKNTERIIELIEYFNGQGQLTEFPTTEAAGAVDVLKSAAWSLVSPIASFVAPEREQDVESFSDDFLNDLDAAVNPILSQAKEKQSNALNMVNDFNFRNGIEMQYNPSSELDYDLFMRSSVNRTLSREAIALEREKTFMYDLAGLSEEEKKDPAKQKEAEDNYYGTNPDTFIGNFAAADRARGTWGEWWEEWMNNYGLALNPLVGAAWGDETADTLKSEYVQKKKNIDQKRLDKKSQLARDFDITPDQLNMPIDQRLSEAINGNMSMGDFFATTYSNTAEIMSDALISSAEFMIPYVGPAVVGIDVYSQNYSDVVAYQPHMGTGEAVLTSASKATAEVLMERLMFTKGLGSVGALKNAAENLGAKRIIKETGKKAAKERGLIANVVGRYLLPEGIEEGLISMTGQVIDMIGDVSAGRNVRDLNTYEVSDAFWAGMVGAVGPSSISTFTSNLGHTKTMENRLQIVANINDLKDQIANETNLDLKEKQEELLRKEMTKLKVVVTDEAAFYSALNPQESKTVISINQELSQIKDTLRKGKYWTKEQVQEADIEGLEKRMEELYKQKAIIENAAVARSEAEMRAEQRSKVVDKKEAAKRSETPTAAEAAPEGQIQEEQELSQSDETTAQVAEDQQVEEVDRERTINDDIEDARRGDVKAQEKLKKYGIEWERTPLYRFISESEVKALKKGETVKGKNPEFGADVTIDPEGEGAGATTTEYRVTFKEDGFDNKKTSSRVRMKNKQDGWVSEGYSMDDVARIEKKNADGTWETVYEADAPTTDAPTETAEEDLTQFPLFEVTDPKLKSDFGKKFRRLSTGVTKGMSEYVEEGTKIYKDEDGIFRPLDGEANELVGSQMSDSFFSPVEEAPVAEEATPEPKAVTEKEYKYLKDVELFYEELMVRNSPKMESREQMSVEVKSYEDYRNLWAGITANGKVPEAMQNIYFIKDGKRYNVKPPKQKVDENGNVVDMNLPQTLREYLLKKSAEEEAKTKAESATQEEVELPKELTEEIDEGVFEKYTGDNPFRKVLNNINRFRKRYFTPQKMLPATASRLIELEGGAYASHLKDVEFSMKEFYSMLEDYKGSQEALLDDYDSALRGDEEAFNRLPENFAIHAKKIRNQVDALSLEAINIGVFDTSTDAGRKTAETVMGKLGSYLMRSYEIYDNENWADQVSDEVITAAKNRIRADIKKAAETEYNDPAVQERFDSFEEYLEDRVDGLIKKYLNKSTAKAFVKGKALLGKGSDINKKLTDIPVEIRALMGEYSDPMKNYAMSIIKLAKAVEGTRTMNQLREVGLNKFLFENPTGQFTAQLASEGSETMRPLNGLYTTPEILEAFESTPALVESFLEKYLMYTSSIKWAKTIGSVATHSKNIIGNLGFMWANGHTDLTKMGVAYKTIKNDLKKGGDAALRARLKKYIELGLTNQNVAIREINEMFGSDNLEAAMLLRSSKKRSVKKTLASIKQVADDLYQAEDDFFKIVAFENEIARYSDALFNKSYEDLNSKEKSAVDEYIANKVVKQTYPSYDRVPEGVRLPSKLWLGNFVSFVAESYRVSFNTLAIAGKEMRSDNPKLKAIGRKRFAGAFSYLNAKNIIVATFGKIGGVGAMGLLGGFLDDEDEKKKQKALKNYVAPWSVNSDLIILEAKDGSFTYVDLSASDPFGSLSQIANAMTKDGLSIESFADGMVQAVAPFIDPDIGTRRLMNIIYNQDDYGKPLYNKEAPIEDQIKDITKAIYEVLEVGTLTSARKIYDSEDKETEILGQISGLKPYTIDVNKAFGYKMARYKTRISDARKLKYDNIDAANTALQGIYQEIYEDSEAAQALGVSFADLRSTMMEWGGLGKQTSKDIMINRYRPLTIKR